MQDQLGEWNLPIFFGASCDTHLLNQSAQSHIGFGSRTFQKLTFQLEYAKPYGLKGQLIDTATYELVFGENTIHSLSNRLSYTYEMSDRIDWVNTLDMLVQQADSSDSARFISNTATTSFNFHLTNKLDLALSLSVVDVIDKPNIDISNDDVAYAANIGLRYRVK